MNKRFFLFSSSINSIKKMKGLDWLEWHVGPVCFGHEHVGEGKKWTKNLGQHICKNGLKWHVGAVCYASQHEIWIVMYFLRFECRNRRISNVFLINTRKANECTFTHVGQTKNIICWTTCCPVCARLYSLFPQPYWWNIFNC